MLDPSNFQGRQRHWWRPALATMLMLAVAAVTGSAQAADFDEKLKAPTMKDPAELRSQAQAYSARFAAIREAAPEQIIRDMALARGQFDVSWKIQRAIDERKPLGEWAISGITEAGDGSYAIDMGGHPEWHDLAQTITALLTHENLEIWIPALVARGFRPEDVAILRDYATANDPQSASAVATLPIAIGFSRAVRKFDKLKRPVPDVVVHSFWYQRARAASESNRLWVDTLMKRLDAQRGRILVSCFLELNQKAYWIPENLSAGIAAQLALVRQPDFESLAIAEVKGVAP